MNKTLYLRAADAEVWREAKRLFGDSISQMVVDMLRRNIQTHYSEQVVVFRRPCLPEDEGRHFYIRTCSRKEALGWIEGQRDEYFKPEDYYISKQEEK